MANKSRRRPAGERVSPSQTAAHARPMSSSAPRSSRVGRATPSVRVWREVTGRLLPTGLDSDYLRAQDALHVLEREAMCLLVEGGDAVLRNDDRIVPVAGVGDRMQHADIGADANDGDCVGSQQLKALIQVGAEEAAVAPLRDYHVSVRSQFGDHIGFLGAADAMRREHAELEVIGSVVVAQKNGDGALRALLREQALDVRYDFAAAGP